MAIVKNLLLNHDGTGHKIAHNITTICNIPLALWFIASVYTLRNADFAGLEAWMSHPINIIAAVLFTYCTLKHFTLEIEVVLEDYISNVSKRNFTIITMKLFALVLGVATTISILKLGL